MLFRKLQDISMKIIGINCSPRKNHTTQKALEVALAAASSETGCVETQVIQLAEHEVRPCLACGHCKTKPGCIQDDGFNDLIPMLSDKSVAGIIIGTPVYLGTMTAQCKAFLDRSVTLRRNGFTFRNVVGGVLAVGGVRNGGQELTIQGVQAAMLCHDMICVSDGNNTSHFGATLFSGSGTVDDDEFGLLTAENLGRRVAQVALMVHNPK